MYTQKINANLKRNCIWVTEKKADCKLQKNAAENERSGGAFCVKFLIR